MEELKIRQVLPLFWETKSKEREEGREGGQLFKVEAHLLFFGAS